MDQPRERGLEDAARRLASAAEDQRWQEPALDPRTMPGTQDRVEVVGFNTPGRYLVMCGVLPHFFDAATQEFVMVGYIDVRND